jgi:FMN reductase
LLIKLINNVRKEVNPMADVALIAGSPSHWSRSSAVLAQLEGILQRRGLSTYSLQVRDLPAADLLYANFESPAIKAATQEIEAASAVVVGTPIYKAAYSGVLKVFLDLLPQRVLAGKVVLPVATGGSSSHLLAIDYALKPVLAALGARYVLAGVYVLDSQLQGSAGQGYTLIDTSITQRFDSAVEELVGGVPGSPALLSQAI